MNARPRKTVADAARPSHQRVFGGRVLGTNSGASPPQRGQSVNDLAAEIDAERIMTSGLASAIRVFVLSEVKAGR